MQINLKWAVIIMTAAFLVLTAVGQAVKTINPADVPGEWVDVYFFIDYVFNGSSIAVLFVMLGNVSGFIWNYLDQTPADRANYAYEASKLWQTWVRYEAYLLAISGAIIAASAGTPYQKHAFIIAGAMGFLIEVIRSTLRKMASTIAST